MMFIFPGIAILVLRRNEIGQIGKKGRKLVIYYLQFLIIRFDMYINIRLISHLKQNLHKKHVPIGIQLKNLPKENQIPICSYPFSM